jgi:uncharacterized protein
VIFVDTSAWFAAAIESDANHAAAVAFLASTPADRLITSDFVLDETLTLFRMRGALQFGVALGKRVLEGAACVLERVSDADLHAAYLAYVRYADKGWSFTDCASLAMMRRLGVKQAFAFDAHFEQFGGIQMLPMRS